MDYGNDNELKMLFECAKRYSIKKIILFGSRAKGINSEYSDYDIAVIGGNITDFYLYVLYDMPSLHKFDVVEYDKANSSLKEEIDKYGVVIYEEI